ncbi:hypothetical protein [Stutzerimonas stutzeri]|uniref:hypothetical protein n=1 Tax=Stutzerimonas stutzeri TaxID=316 RepID=UPI0021ADB596|nr:hypothetical protein [Stutzerimonas stutzeri]
MTEIAPEPWAVAIEADSQPVVIEHLREYAVTQDVPELLMTAAGEQGPPGIPGPAGGTAIQCSAGATLSALRVVYELAAQVFALDYRDAQHIDLLLGITTSAAGAGAPINVQRSGVLDDSSWSWLPGRIYLAADGALTQTPPSDGYCVLIGAATSATSIILNLQDPIELEI